MSSEKFVLIMSEDKVNKKQDYYVDNLKTTEQ